MNQVLRSVASRVDSSSHPLLAAREQTADSRTLVIVITGDKGLCGSFNANVIKAAGQFVLESPTPCLLGLVGRKGRDFFARRGFAVFFEQVGVFQRLDYARAQSIAQLAVDAFTSGEMDRVVLVYNEFKSVITQRVVVDQLLPIPREEVGAGPAVEGQGAEYLYEPAPQRILDELLPRHVEIQVARALLETNAAFFAAQMTAMDTATKNSAEMISALTLYMNKVRQAAITREIIEVVSGAEAL
jgi:F-type H+-transporting ATPase subunit gamma